MNMGRKILALLFAIFKVPILLLLHNTNIKSSKFHLTGKYCQKRDSTAFLSRQYLKLYCLGNVLNI